MAESGSNTKYYLSRKLIMVVAAFIIAGSGLVVLTNLSINATSSLSSFTNLLSGWNHYHHKAVNNLIEFGRSAEPRDFREYENAVQKMNSYKATAAELMQENPHAERIFRSFGSDLRTPSEISSLIFVFNRLNEIGMLDKVYGEWKQLDSLETGLAALASSIHSKWKSGQPEPDQVALMIDRVQELNSKWSSHYGELLSAVGLISTRIKQYGLWISVILGILLVLIGVVVSVRAGKSINEWEDTLREKRVLLTEIHHRVKNNLAVVSGLLKLEEMKEENNENALKESIGRIQSMALIHELLYQSETFSDVNIQDYLEQLLDHISETYIPENKDITFDLELDNVRMNINQAVPVGLVVNEMVANAIEHGFAEEKQGTISVRLFENEGTVTISVDNNGAVSRDIVQPKQSGSSGMDIVQTLVKQLDGEMEIDDGDGFGFRLTFRKSDASGAGNASL